MYICEECGAVFEEYEVYKEQHPYGMGYSTEEIAVCPYCKETGIKAAKKCSRCDNWVAELEDGLCDACYGDVYGEE